MNLELLAAYLVIWFIRYRVNPAYGRIPPATSYRLVTEILSYFFLIGAILEFLFIGSEFDPYFVLIGLVLMVFSIYLRNRSVIELGRRLPSHPQYAKGLELITTGVYRYIRHPMYLSSLMWYVGSILFLGLIFVVTVFLLIFVTTILRIGSEEKALLKKEPAYAAYKKRTWRLIPFVY